jgi:hypothetical protein
VSRHALGSDCLEKPGASARRLICRYAARRPRIESDDYANENCDRHNDDVNHPVSRIPPQRGTHGLAPLRDPGDALIRQQEKVYHLSGFRYNSNRGTTVRKRFGQLEFGPHRKRCAMCRVILAAALSSLASVGLAEEVYLLKIESIGFYREKQPPENESVFSAIELIVQPGQPFHVEFTNMEWSSSAKGRISKTNHDALLLQISYERKSTSGRHSSQTSVEIMPGEPLLLGAVYDTAAGKEQLFSKEAVRVTLKKREGNQSADAQPVRATQKTIKIVPVRSPDSMTIERGMIFDAIEHELRIKKSLQDKRELPTTMDRGRLNLRPPISELQRD